LIGISLLCGRLEIYGKEINGFFFAVCFGASAGSFNKISVKEEFQNQSLRTKR